MPVKQVIVVNEALRLPRGKLAAQVAHASVGAFLAAQHHDRSEWLASTPMDAKFPAISRLTMPCSWLQTRTPRRAVAGSAPRSCACTQAARHRISQQDRAQSQCAGHWIG